MKDMWKGLAKVSNDTKSVRTTSIDKVSSVTEGGKSINVEAHSNSEVRELSPMMPYGISSSPPSGLSIQVIYNKNGNDAVVGVDDKNRPDVEQGEVVLYTSFGQTIELRKDGNIYIKATKGSVVFADGTNGIARVGDTVSVNVPTHGACTGTITGGSTKVKCG